MRLDVKWLLIRNCIESKNPRKNQYSINREFAIGLSGHFVDEHTIADINRNNITHVRDIQRPALTYFGLQSWTNKKTSCSSNCRCNWV